MNKKLVSKLIKLVIAALLSWWVGVGVRLLAFTLPTSHFWQTVIAVVVALSLFIWSAFKINKNG